MSLDKLRFDDRGLITAVIQDSQDGTVLMVAYMNREAVEKTQQTGLTWFYSRSRQRLWQKGETSGHVQRVKEILYDCDGDTLLVKVEQTGPACHEGTRSCFARNLHDDSRIESPEKDMATVYGGGVATIIADLYGVIADRKQNPQAGSYTTYLFEKGQDKILKKVGEESAETIIASKNHDKSEILYEMADLWYHCLVTLAYHDIAPSELLHELCKRRK